MLGDRHRSEKLARAVVYNEAVTDEIIRNMSADLAKNPDLSIFDVNTGNYIYNWFDSHGLIPQSVKTILTISSGAGGITRATWEDEKCVTLIEENIIYVTEHMGDAGAGTAIDKLGVEYNRIDAILVEYMSSTAQDPAAVELERTRRSILHDDNIANLESGTAATRLYTVFNDLRTIYFNRRLAEAGISPELYNINIRLVTGNDRLMHWERTQDGFTYTIVIDVDALKDVYVLREELSGELFNIGSLIVKKKIPPSEAERDAFRNILQRTPNPSQVMTILFDPEILPLDKQNFIARYIEVGDGIDTARFVQISDYIIFEARNEVATDMYKIKSFADPHTFNNVEEQAHYLATLLADNQ
ncbi:MAG: hypothetical protein ACYSSL_04460, partial [Planctomycetota bacterium]